VAAQEVVDGRAQAGVAQVAQREVDGHPHDEAGVVPGAALAQRLVQHPGRQRHDQAGLLGQGDEAGGRDRAGVRVRPARQRLHPVASLRAGRDPGLVVQRERPPLDGAAQVGDEGQAHRVVPVEGRGVEGMAALVAPGRVHGDIGALEQVQSPFRGVIPARMARRGGDDCPMGRAPLDNAVPACY